MTLAALKSELQRIVRYAADIDLYTDDIGVAMLNHAYQKCVAFIGFPVWLLDISVDAGSRYVYLHLSHSVVNIRQSWWKNTGGSTFVTLSKLEHRPADYVNTANGVPTTIFTWGGQAELYPVNSSSGTLRIEAVRLPADDDTVFPTLVNDTDVPNLPVELHYDLVFYAFYLWTRPYPYLIQMGEHYRSLAEQQWLSWRVSSGQMVYEMEPPEYTQAGALFRTAQSVPEARG